MARYEVIVPGWAPHRLNELMTGHWGTRARRKTHDCRVLRPALVAFGVRPAAGPRRVSLHITLGPRQREGDEDNRWKSVLDALVREGALVDDGPRWCARGSLTYERGQGRQTRIVLEDLEPVGNDNLNPRGHAMSPSTNAQANDKTNAQTNEETNAQPNAVPPEVLVRVGFRVRADDPGLEAAAGVPCVVVDMTALRVTLDAAETMRLADTLARGAAECQAAAALLHFGRAAGWDEPALVALRDAFVRFVQGHAGRSPEPGAAAAEGGPVP